MVSMFAPALSPADALRWMPVTERDGGMLKLILRPHEFRALGSGHARCGLYRGSDSRGNAVTVRVIEES